jgi:hypothetical protein
MINTIQNCIETIEVRGGRRSADLLKKLTSRVGREFDREFDEVKSKKSLVDRIFDIIREELVDWKDDINAIPASDFGPCADLCVTLAEIGVTRNITENLRPIHKLSMGKAMLLQAAQWFHCQNEETIIFTRNWDDDVFDDDFRGLLDAYKGAYPRAYKKVFVIEISRAGFILRYY